MKYVFKKQENKVVDHFIHQFGMMILERNDRCAMICENPFHFRFEHANEVCLKISWAD